MYPIDQPISVPKDTVLYIKWVGVGYGDYLPSSTSVTPRRPESYNYLYFTPTGGSAVELQFSGFGYDVMNYNFTVQEPGTLWVSST